MIALRVGALIENAVAWTAINTNSSHGWRSPSTACSSSPRVELHSSTDEASNRRRRSTVSEMAPPQMPNTTSGTSPASPSSPTYPDEWVSAYICTCTATDVNWNPKLDTALPMNTRRYGGWRSGRVSMLWRRRNSRVLLGEAVVVTGPTAPRPTLPWLL